MTPELNVFPTPAELRFPFFVSFSILSLLAFLHLSKAFEVHSGGLLILH
jgi:hypothetical protein